MHSSKNVAIFKPTIIMITCFCFANPNTIHLGKHNYLKQSVESQQRIKRNNWSVLSWRVTVTVPPRPLGDGNGPVESPPASIISFDKEAWGELERGSTSTLLHLYGTRARSTPEAIDHTVSASMLQTRPHTALKLHPGSRLGRASKRPGRNQWEDTRLVGRGEAFAFIQAIDEYARCVAESAVAHWVVCCWQNTCTMSHRALALKWKVASFPVVSSVHVFCWFDCSIHLTWQNMLRKVFFHKS